MTTNSVAQVISPSMKKAMQFPFLDLCAQYATIREEVQTAVQRVLDTQHFILGPEVEAFEQEFARSIDVRFAIGCASGSDALLLALMALGVGEGDEVVTTPFTFVATAGSIARLNARPVFVDIDAVTYNIDPQKIEAAITPKTRAIIPVHLFGLAADLAPTMEIARKHDVPVIEDAAQAVGATYEGSCVGRVGAIGCFSFFPSKNLGGAGDGGMLTTNDPTIADRLKVLRVHGSRRKYQYELLGFNSRLDSLQAAILRVKMRHLAQWTSGRQRNAASYQRLFNQMNLSRWVTTPVTPEGRNHVYNQFVIRAQNRDELQGHLRQDGIPTEVYYPSPLHLEKAFGYLGYKPGDFPVAESASNEVLALPVYPELTEAQQRSVVDSIAEFYYKSNS
jgi:dTDP-4-amino-4,6-dideoxygalactose transaminase